MAEQAPGGPPKDISGTPPTDAESFRVTPEQAGDAALSATEMDRITTDLESAGVISGTGSEKRITAEDAAKSQAEKEAAMSRLMDKMEASVETQGQYFVRLGDKVPLTKPQQDAQSVDAEIETGVDDRRVLILKALVVDQGGAGADSRYTKATMVTRDGIKVVTIDARQDKYDRSGLNYEILSNLINGSEPAAGTGLVRFTDGTEQIKIGYNKKNGESESALFSISGGFPGARPDDGTPNKFEDRIRQSIEKTESPHKKVVENNTAETQLAASAAGFIQSLPPRA